MDTYNPHKRRKLERYPYPPIPQSDQDNDDYRQTVYNQPFSLREVPFTSSTDWGIGGVAQFRALNVSHITKENEELVRSHHPALSLLKQVWISESVFRQPVWIVDSPVERVEAGGRLIHFWPGDYLEYVQQGILTPRSPGNFNSHFQRDINPMRFLTSSDLNSFRELFPRSVGVEVLIAGFIIILFDRISDVEDAYHDIWPLELAGLRVCFNVARYDCTTAPITSGMVLSHDQSDEHHSNAGCLGLKLRLPDGLNVITTVTHGFVHSPRTPHRSRFVIRLRGVYDRVKTSLMRYLPGRVDQPDTAHVVSQPPLTNSPIGKIVWLASSNRRVGTITRTYDAPSLTVPYPCGYVHDLSLISDPDLPDITNTPGYPMATGWADYSAALEKQDVYVVCHLTSVKRWRCITGTVDDTLFKRVAVLGTGYSWDKVKHCQNAYLLWHTGAELSPADGYSGSPLFLGRPNEDTSKAIVFQNFQKMCMLKGEKPRQEALIKGGFLLPSEIRNSRIMGTDNHVYHQQFESTPVRGRQSNETYRRIVSGV